MKRIAVLSDIHANLKALEAALTDVERQKPELIAVLGDTINYGPNPRECFELVDSVADLVLAGNHEKEAALPMPDEMESDAREMLEWTVTQLHGVHAWDKMKAALLHDAAACAQRHFEGVHFVHATAAKPFEQYLWPGHPNYHLHLNPQLDTYLLELLQGFSAQHSFVGHTHAPTVLTAYANRELFPIANDWNRKLTFLGPNTIFYVPQGELTLEGLAGKKLVLNPGSVGQPRDGDPRACFVVVDGRRVEYHRIAYDFRRTQAKILAAGLHPALAERLARGK